MKNTAKKRLISLALSAVTLLSLPTAAMAADTTSNNVAVNGTIAAITALDITVPVSTTFTIDENRDFSAPTLAVQNNSPVPVTVVAQSLTADASSPKVVAQDKFTDEEWENLNGAQTQSNIALGLKVLEESSDLRDPVTSATQWFGAEGTDSNLALGVLQSAHNADIIPKLSLGFDGKYGSVWGDMNKITYTMILTFSVD